MRSKERIKSDIDELQQQDEYLDYLGEVLEVVEAQYQDIKNLKSYINDHGFGRDFSFYKSTTQTKIDKIFDAISSLKWNMARIYRSIDEEIDHAFKKDLDKSH